MILNKEELNLVSKNVINDILQKYKKEIQEIILFGSYAKNTPNNNSDIDYLILFKNKTPKISDLCFSYEYAIDYFNKHNVKVHIVFEFFHYYIKGCEEFYKNVPNYGITIFKDNK